MATKDDYINELRAEIVHLRSMLEPLEAGMFRTEIRRADEPRRDTTQGQIDHLKRTISDYQSVVDRHDNA